MFFLLLVLNVFASTAIIDNCTDDICNAVIKVDGVEKFGSKQEISKTIVNLEYNITDIDGNVTGVGNHDCDRYTFPADYTIELTNAAAEKQAELELRTALASQNCGRIVQARMLIRNSKKTDLTRGDKIQIISDYSSIVSLLSTGSLPTARDEILAAVPDGKRVTQDDVTALVAELDKCNPVP